MRLLVILLASLGMQKAFADSGLTGTWEVKQKCMKCAVQPDGDFALRFKVNGRKVCGTHSSVVQGGNKVDEQLDAVTLEGRMMGSSSAEVRFSSSFSGSGTARVVRQGRELSWKIISDEGMHWLPSQATLRLVKDTRWGSKLKCVV